MKWREDVKVKSQKYKEFRKINKFLLGFVVLLFGVVIVLAGLEIAEISQEDKKELLVGSESVLLNPENEVILEGKSEVIHYDYFDEGKSENFYYIKTIEGERYKLNFPLGNEPNIISGERIRVSGILATSPVASGQDEGIFDVQGFEIIEDESVVAGAEEEENPNLGEQRTAVILLNSLNNPTIPFTPEQIEEAVFSKTHNRSANKIMREFSLGKTWLEGNVYGWYNLSLSLEELCQYAGFSDVVVNEIDPDIYFLNYTRLIFILPSINAAICDFGGLASVGWSDVPLISQDGEFYATITVINAVFNEEVLLSHVLPHELGHNFGLRHANGWECDEGIIEGNCYINGYDDWIDTMGNGIGYFSAMRMKNVGWFNSSNILDIPLGNSGVYYVSPLETNDLGVKVLNLITLSEFNYSVEFRRPIGYDKEISDFYMMIDEEQIFDGAIVRKEYSDGNSAILDMTPIANINSANVYLANGQTFRDDFNNIKISVLNVTDEYLQVGIGGSFSCGNNIFEEWEECEGLNLNGDTCGSLGYREGILSCDHSCKFDMSLCGPMICSPGHSFIGGNSCESVFNSDGGNGISLNRFSLSSEFTWNDARHLSEGMWLTDSDRIYFEIRSQSNNGEIQRLYLPFDTSSIPDNADINSAKIVLSKFNNYIENTHPESNDFLVIVPATIENPPHLGYWDFDQFGSVDNPLELSNRIDVSEEISNNNDILIIFNINEEGYPYLNASGFSSFGIRVGYDLFSNLPNNGEFTNLLVRLNTARHSIHPPILYVNYSVPLCGNSILEEGEQCDDGNLVNGDGCSATCGIETHYKVFMTSSTYNGKIAYGNYFGINAADMICNAKARDAGYAYSKKWKAWLSGSAQSASQRIYHSSKAYRTKDLNIVANNWNDLVDGSLDNPINLDERGNIIASSKEFEEDPEVRAWTGTGSDGLAYGGTCGNWTSTAGDGSAGIVAFSGYFWTGVQADGCNRLNHLYCFEQPSCGNGFVDQSNEQCDDGNTNNNDGCSTDCRLGSGGGKETPKDITPPRDGLTA